MLAAGTSPCSGNADPLDGIAAHPREPRAVPVGAALIGVLIEHDGARNGQNQRAKTDDRSMASHGDAREPTRRM